MRTHETWTKTLEAWQGTLPPLLDPTAMDSHTAVRAVAGVQRAALATWLESCQQAHDLAEHLLGWQAEVMEDLAERMERVR